MGLFDDLSARFEREAGSVIADAKTYLNQRVATQVVKVAQPKTGNLTAAQVAAGARGSTQSVAIAPMAQSSSNDFMKFAPMILIGAVALFFISKRK